MSGPVGAADAGPGSGGDRPEGPTVEVLAARTAEVAGLPVRRTLPRRGRRTVGAWCFLDHFGPVPAAEATMHVGPHPHIGLQTVTWLVEGHVVHADSLGSEQPIRPGQLNLMTAGHGIAHAEVTPAGTGGATHGAQLWVAQPEATRHTAPAFEHHGELPRVGLPGGAGVATVLVGALAGHPGERSPARTDTPLVGAELDLAAGAGGAAGVRLALDPAFEHAVVVLAGRLTVDGTPLAPGALAYLGEDRAEVAVAAPEATRALVLGGTPLGEALFMWWNFVARTADEVLVATADWDRGDRRFGPVASPLDRVPAPRPDVLSRRR